MFGGTMRDNVMRGIGSHDTPHQGATNEWLTPPGLIKSLGAFDLDPCSPVHRPWDTARKHYTIEDDGLSQLWRGRVWLNPPYGPHTGKWLAKLAEHGNGIALVFARTETKMFFEHVWNQAHAVLFLRGRVQFFDVGGTQHTSSGGPSVLVAYGQTNAHKLSQSGLVGALCEFTVVGEL